jgi:phosphoglucomutase
VPGCVCVVVVVRVQSLFYSLSEEIVGKTIGLGGDGRYYNKEAAQTIIKLAAGNGVKKVIVGQNAIMATPAMSAVIREQKLYGLLSPPSSLPSPSALTACAQASHVNYGDDPELIAYLNLSSGGIIMSASHNPGGPDEDFGIKFNYNSGEPAPERITDAIYNYTTTISELKMADIPDIDLATVGVTKFGDFEVEVVDPVAVYKELLSKVFDFDMLKTFLKRSDVSIVFDCMWAVTAAYAKPIFVRPQLD